MEVDLFCFSLVNDGMILRRNDRIMGKERVWISEVWVLPLPIKPLMAISFLHRWEGNGILLLCVRPEKSQSHHQRAREPESSSIIISARERAQGIIIR